MVISPLNSGTVPKIILLSLTLTHHKLTLLINAHFSRNDQLPAGNLEQKSPCPLSLSYKAVGWLRISAKTLSGPEWRRRLLTSWTSRRVTVNVPCTCSVSWRTVQSYVISAVSLPVIWSVLKNVCLSLCVFKAWPVSMASLGLHDFFWNVTKYVAVMSQGFMICVSLKGLNERPNSSADSAEWWVFMVWGERNAVILSTSSYLGKKSFIISEKSQAKEPQNI